MVEKTSRGGGLGQLTFSVSSRLETVENGSQWKDVTLKFPALKTQDIHYFSYSVH